jgi:GNAT superfamily N-acetyltransferase
VIDIRIHAYLRAHAERGDAERIGPFVACFDPHSADPYRNYAIPDDHARPGAAQVEALIETFSTRERTPRLEYLPRLCSAVRPVLHTAGFTVEGHLPVLVGSPGQTLDAGTPPGIELLLATSEEELRASAEAQNEAYGVATTVPADVARLRDLVASGGLVALARDAGTGEPAGSGLCTPPHDGVGELAAVGVRAPFRCRGIAAALTALLTRRCPEVGITTPFLTPGGDAGERVYRRVGYTRVTEILHISVGARVSAM